MGEIFLDIEQAEVTSETLSSGAYELVVIQQKLNESAQQLLHSWKGSGRDAFEKEWLEWNTEFQRLVDKTHEISSDIKHSTQAMLHADLLSRTIMAIQENKELLAALITLSVPIVQHLLDRRQKKSTEEEKSLKIKIEIEGRATEITEKDVASNEALLSRLLEAHPDLDRVVSKESKVKILTSDKEKGNKAIIVHLEDEHSA